MTNKSLIGGMKTANNDCRFGKIIEYLVLCAAGFWL